MDTTVKRKRGRPRKNTEIVPKPKKKDNEEKHEENIVLFLALDPDDSEHSTSNGSDRQTESNGNSSNGNSSNVNSSDVNKSQKKGKGAKVKDMKKISKHDKDEYSETNCHKSDSNKFTAKNTLTCNSDESGSNESGSDESKSESSSNQEVDDSESEDSDSSAEIFDPRHMNAKILIEEIRKRDARIKLLEQQGGGSILNSCNGMKPLTVSYHCTIVADNETGKVFKPKPNDYDCWWCDYGFDTLPVYIPNFYRDDTFFILGNFCSFSCAGKYNAEMLNDGKCLVRLGLLQQLKKSATGSDDPIKYAPRRELLLKKGGKYTIKQFRRSFDIPSLDLYMSMPPMIPLVHTIEEGSHE